MNIQDWSPLGWTSLISLLVQGTLKSLLQHHSSKASILRCSAFFIVQLSHPYMTTGKTIALTRWTFVDKVMSLLFNMLSRLVITFLPRSKRLLISWLQSPSAVILEPQKIATVSPSISHEVMGHNLVSINKYNPHKQKLFVILVYLWKYKGVLTSNFKNQCFKAYPTRKSWPLVRYAVLWLISWVTLIPLDELAENRPIKDRTIVVEKWGCQSVAPLNTVTSQSFKTTAMSHFNIVVFIFSQLPYSFIQ